MIEKIKNAITGKKLSGWQIRETRETSHQLFLAKEERECVRSVETQLFRVTLYQRRKSAGARNDVLGIASFQIGAAELPALEKRIDEAIFSASLVNNQLFELPSQPESLPVVERMDPSLSVKTLDECEERIKKAVSNEKQIRLSAAEFFMDRVQTRLVNHHGLDVEQEGTVLETEFILLAESGSRENEYINRYKRRFLSDFDLEGEVKQSAQFAREATVATLPKTGPFPVLLSGEPLDHLFNPLVARASARLKYNRMVETELGSSVASPGEIKGDSIHVWHNALLKGGLGSYRFDGFGTPGARVRLIENNIVRAFLAEKRYADYLNVPVTGEEGNIEVGPGSIPFNHLLDPERLGGGADGDVLYHLQAFSAFEPNVMTGAFSAEIRAGFEISRKGVRPIKGGSVTGVLQEAIKDCRLSKERVQRERVLVPQGIFFKSLTLAGE